MGRFKIVQSFLLFDYSIGYDFGNLVNGSGLSIQLVGSFEGEEFLFNRGEILLYFVHYLF